MRKFTLELAIDGRIIHAGTTPDGLLYDLSEEHKRGALQSWDGNSGVVRCTGEGIIVPLSIQDYQKSYPCAEWPILYTWKLKQVGEMWGSSKAPRKLTRS